MNSKWLPAGLTQTPGITCHFSAPRPTPPGRPHWQWPQRQQHSAIALPLRHATPSRSTRLCANPQLELEITGLGLGRMLVTTDIRYLPVPACGMRTAPTENYDTTGRRQAARQTFAQLANRRLCLPVRIFVALSNLNNPATGYAFA